MRINNNDMWQWYVDFFLGNSGKVRPLLNKKTNNDNCDTFQLSWQAKRAVFDAHIEETINSGEPLKGVSYEDFCIYYYNKHTYRLSECDMKIEYQQALKGDNASLREKEWRTNPDYRVPQRLFSSPEVTADREAVLEKLRRNEKLEEWETRLLNTFPNAYEGNLRENEARLEGQKVKYQNFISSALSEAGIELSEDDELQFEVWGYDITVTGTISDDKLALLNEKLADKALGFQYIYQQSGHIDEAKAGGFALVYLQSAEHILKEAGGGSVFDIGKDANGNFTGLPGDLGEFIKKNAIGKFGIGVDEKYKDREEDIKKALYMRETFNAVIKTVQNGSYDRLKSMTCKLTYKNGILSC